MLARCEAVTAPHEVTLKLSDRPLQVLEHLRVFDSSNLPDIIGIATFDLGKESIGNLCCRHIAPPYGSLSDTPESPPLHCLLLQLWVPKGMALHVEFHVGVTPPCPCMGGFREDTPRFGLCPQGPARRQAVNASAQDLGHEFVRHRVETRGAVAEHVLAGGFGAPLRPRVHR